MDEENKKISIDSFFNRVEEVDQVAGNALKQSNLNVNTIQANKTLIESLSFTIETMKTEIRDIANYIIVERKLEKDAEEDRKLELEDAEQKKSMTDRALALSQPAQLTSKENSIAPQSGSEGGGGNFLSGLLGAIATGGLIALAAPLVPVIAPLLLKAMAVGITAIAGGLLIKKLAEITPKILKKVNDGLKAGFEKTKELYKNLEGKFLKLAGDVGGFLKKKGKQSINLLKRTTGGVADFLTGGVFDFDKKGESASDNFSTLGMTMKVGKSLFEPKEEKEKKEDKLPETELEEFESEGKQSINLLKRTTGGAADFLTGGVFDFDKKGEGITDNVLIGNKLASQGLKGVIDNMKDREEESEEPKEEEKKFKVTTGKKDMSVEDLEREYEAAQSEVSKRQAAYDENRTVPNERWLTYARKQLNIKKIALDAKKREMGLASQENKDIGKMIKESGMGEGEGKSSYSATTEYKIVEPFTENKNVNIEVQKKNDLDLSLKQNLETSDKLVNAVSYQSGIESKDQNSSVLVQSKPAQVTIASIKKTSSPVAFIKSNKNKFLSINETELPPEVARMLT